jgi:hypothetical protein
LRQLRQQRQQSQKHRHSMRSLLTQTPRQTGLLTQTFAMLTQSHWIHRQRWTLNLPRLLPLLTQLTMLTQFFPPVLTRGPTHHFESLRRMTRHYI